MRPIALHLRGPPNSGVEALVVAIQMAHDLHVDRTGLLQRVRAGVLACFNAAAGTTWPHLPHLPRDQETRDVFLNAWTDPAFRAAVDVNDPSAHVLARLEELDWLSGDDAPDWVLLRAPEQADCGSLEVVVDLPSHEMRVTVHAVWAPDLGAADFPVALGDLVVVLVPVGLFDRPALRAAAFHVQGLGSWGASVLPRREDLLRLKLAAGMRPEMAVGGFVPPGPGATQAVLAALNLAHMALDGVPADRPVNLLLLLRGRTSAEVDRVRRSLADINDIMAVNIDRVLARGESLEDLVERSADLSVQSLSFYKSAKKTDNVMADLESCINCCSGLVAWCMRPTMPRCDLACLCRPVEALLRCLCCPLRALARPADRGCTWLCRHVCEPCFDCCLEPFCDRVALPLLRPLCRPVGRLCDCVGSAVVRAGSLCFPHERIFSAGHVVFLLIRAFYRSLLYVFTLLRFVRDRVVDCLSVVALLLLFLPAMFMLLVLRPTKAEVESTEFVQRAEVMETESAAKTATRRSHLVFRTLPMTALILIAPAVIVGFVMPELDEWAALLILGAQLGLMVVIQGLGTVRAAASWLELYRARAREHKPVPTAPPFSLSNPANLLAIATLVVDVVQMASFPLSPSSSSSSDVDAVEEGDDDGGVIPLPSWCGDVFNVAYIQVAELADEWTAIDSILVAVAAVWVLIMIFARQFVHDLVCYSLMQRNEFKGEARQFFFGSFVGSVMYAHGRPHNVTANVALAIKLLTHTGFMVITSHLLQALACDYSGAAPVLIADPTVTCWEGEHQAVALAALVAFGYYLPLSVMIQPILSNRLEETPTAVRTVQVYAMATTLFKCVLLIVSSLTTSIEARVSTIFVIAVLMAASTFVWFVQLPASVLGAHQPISVAFFNRVKVLTYALCAWSAAVMLAALEETVVTEADFSTWLLAGWAPITALVLGWQLLGERYGIQRKALKPFRLEVAEADEETATPASVFVGTKTLNSDVHRLVDVSQLHFEPPPGVPMMRHTSVLQALAQGRLPAREDVSEEALLREFERILYRDHPPASLGVPLSGGAMEALVRSAPLGDDGGLQCVALTPVVRDAAAAAADAEPAELVVLVRGSRAWLPAAAAALRALADACRPQDAFAVAVQAGARWRVLQPLARPAKLDRGRFNGRVFDLLADAREPAGQPSARGLRGLAAAPHVVVLDGLAGVAAAVDVEDAWPALRSVTYVTGPGGGGHQVGTSLRVLRDEPAAVLRGYERRVLRRLDGVELAGCEPVTFDGVAEEPPAGALPWTRYALAAAGESVPGRVGSESLAFPCVGAGGGGEPELRVAGGLVMLADAVQELMDAKDAQREQALRDLRAEAEQWLVMQKGHNASVAVSVTPGAMAMDRGDFGWVGGVGSPVDMRDPRVQFVWHRALVRAAPADGVLSVQLPGGRHESVPLDEELLAPAGTHTARWVGADEPTVDPQDEALRGKLAAAKQALVAAARACRGDMAEVALRAAAVAGQLV